MNKKILNSIKKSTKNLSDELISVEPEFESKAQVKTRHARTPDQESVLELISDLSDRFNKEIANESTHSLKELIISNIIITFGLNRIENKNNQDGGLVTTEINAKKGIYANENQTFHRNEYVGYKYKIERDKYKKKNIFNEKIKDTYTGRLLNPSEIDIDHINSVNAIHQEYGFMLTTEDRSKIGSNAGNFAATSASLNRSKRDQKLSETAIKHNLDKRRTNAAEKRSEKSLNNFKPDIIDKASYYTSNGIKTSIEQGFSSGVHIMIGEFLKELILISFEKIQDLGSKTAYTSTFKYITEIIKKLIETLGDVAKKWSSIMSNAADGFISSFISNITTIIVNSIYSTASNIIRMIKQGFYSILKAVKIFLFPPAGMTNREAYDTATKILIGGIITLAGVVLEESLKAFLITIPIISALATEISSILCGLLTGIAMSLIFSILDKIDLFGVKDEKRHIFIIKKLTEMENLADGEHKALLSEFNSLEDEFNIIDNQIKIKIENL